MPFLDMLAGLFGDLAVTWDRHMYHLFMVVISLMEKNDIFTWDGKSM